ncbi:MAG: hypothetical protein LBK61_00250 [Spirochaetaceae bacterium]|jgi:hypothetical protein|nr:hypothetical protein [Spirochaetaceae bacterium]
MTRKTRTKTGVYVLSVFSRLLFWGNFIILAFTPFYVFSHDLTVMGGMTNFTSDKAQVTVPPVIDDQVTNYTGSITLSGEFSQNMTYELDAGLDTVWRYYLAGGTAFRLNALKLGFGTFFQYSDIGKEFLNPSMIVNIGFEFPGFFFVDCVTILSFYENLAKIGNFGYNYLAGSAGYWTQNLIAGFNFDTREFEEQRVDTLQARNSLTRYFFHAAIHDKNRRFTVNLDIGYEVLEFEMAKTDSGLVKTEALFAGLEFIVQLTNGFAWHMKGELPYPFEYPSDLFWYTVLAGITIKLAD